jgi:hypothetical protein
MPLDSAACDVLEAAADSMQKGAMTSGTVTAVSSFAMGASLNLLYGLVHMM